MSEKMDAEQKQTRLEESVANLLDYAMAVAHERELDVLSQKHDTDRAVASFLSAARRELTNAASPTDELYCVGCGRIGQIEAVTGPCGQCKSLRQPCDCQVSAMLKERGLVAVNRTHFRSLCEMAKNHIPDDGEMGLPAVAHESVVWPEPDGLADESLTRVISPSTLTALPFSMKNTFSTKLYSEAKVQAMLEGRGS